jgi:hypothetical protein
MLLGRGDLRLALVALGLGAAYVTIVELWTARRGGTIISPSDVIEYFGVSVFIAFFCAVIGMLFLFDGSVLLSILALLLGRLLFQATERVLKDIERLDKNYAAEIAPDTPILDKVS